MIIALCLTCLLIVVCAIAKFIAVNERALQAEVVEFDSNGHVVTRRNNQIIQSVRKEE